MATGYSLSELSYTSVPLSSLPSVTLGARADGRTGPSYRPIWAAKDVVKSAWGSARVGTDGLDGTTEVWAAVKGEVEEAEDVEGAEGEVGGRVVVNLDCTPTASQVLPATLLTHVQALLTSLFSPPSLDSSFLTQLLVIPPPSAKAFTLYLDVLISSSDAGNVIDLAVLAARAALGAVRLPETRAIGYDATNAMDTTTDELKGMTGLLKGGKIGAATVDFELVDSSATGEGYRLKGWENLPVAITLSLVNQLPFLDATLLESAAASASLTCAFIGSQEQFSIAAVRQLGTGEVDATRMVSMIKEAQNVALQLRDAINQKLEID